MDTGCGEKPCPICGNLTHEDVPELDTLRKDNKRLRDALGEILPMRDRYNDLGEAVAIARKILEASE